MGRRKTAVPLMQDWQAEMLLELLTDFYAAPENQRAFEAWQKERRRQRCAARAKKPAGAANTDELTG